MLQFQPASLRKTIQNCLNILTIDVGPTESMAYRVISGHIEVTTPVKKWWTSGGWLEDSNCWADSVDDESHYEFIAIPLTRVVATASEEWSSRQLKSGSLIECIVSIFIFAVHLSK